MMCVLRYMIVLAVLLLPLTIQAKPLITVSMNAEKEVVVVSHGEISEKRVAASNADSGDVIFYTINFNNSGNETAFSAVLEDPIPKGSVYLSGSAYGNAADITFSIDNGKTFKKPSLLTYEASLRNSGNEKRIVSPEEYTHIRWTISAIPAQGSGQIGFKVRMK
jgi:uncharacterized repeat protein (TIGR01451 family)